MRYVLVLLIVFSSTFSIAQNKKIDFRNTAWKPVDSTGFFEYFTTSTTNDHGSYKKLVLKMVGWLNDHSKKLDPSILGRNFLTSIADSLLAKYSFIKLPGKNSTGYIKMNFKKWLLSVFKNEVHFTIFFPGNYSLENLHTDSLYLSGLNLFKDINVLSLEKAIAKYEKDGDMAWRSLHPANPFPVSLELRLNDTLLRRNEFDSVAHLLQKQFPEKIELAATALNGLLDSDDNQNTTLIFKFIIF